MGQDSLIVLLLKIGLVSGFVSLTGWVLVYTRLTHRKAWKNPIGLTLMVKTLLIAGLFVPTALSLFFNLNRLDSRIAAWADVVLIGAVTPVMCWRTAVWIRLHRLGELPRNGDSGKDGG